MTTKQDSVTIVGFMLVIKANAYMLLLLFVLFNPADAKSPDDLPQYYLYGSNDSFPVIDYHPADDAPDFLYGVDQGPRVVEFYFHACHHCRNFRTRYVDFARDISNRTNDSVKCYGISCASNFKICRKMNITSFPTVILFAKSATTYTQKINYWQLNLTAVLKILEVDIQQTPVTRKSVLQESRNGREIVDNLKGFDGSLWLRKNPKMVPTGGIQKSSNRHNSKDLIVNDIHLSFDFHLRNEIFTSEDSPLDEHSKEVLREWLILLQKTTPTFWHLQTLIKHMLHEFDSVISSEAMLLNLLDQYPNPSMGHDADWSEGCSHGQKGNGFTCGIWLLYHVMTIGLVEYNDNVATNGSDLISTVGAAETLKLYINTFFRCEDCRYHFTKDYDNCSFDRCQRLRSDDFSLLQSIELSIWLVETHNGVAKRLLDESSEPISDQEKLSKEWPDRRVCPHCWDSEGVLNHINTFDFLKSEYWPSNHVDVSLRNLSAISLLVTVPMSWVALALFVVAAFAYQVYFKRSVQMRIRIWKKKSLNDKAIL